MLCISSPFQPPSELCTLLLLTVCWVCHSIESNCLQLLKHLDQQFLTLVCMITTKGSFKKILMLSCYPRPAQSEPLKYARVLNTVLCKNFQGVSNVESGWVRHLSGKQTEAVDRDSLWENDLKRSFSYLGLLGKEKSPYCSLFQMEIWNLFKSIWKIDVKSDSSKY